MQDTDEEDCQARKQKSNQNLKPKGPEAQSTAGLKERAGKDWREALVSHPAGSIGGWISGVQQGPGELNEAQSGNQESEGGATQRERQRKA